MNLTEYNTICAQMGAYCKRAYSQINIDGEICPRVSACDVETLEGYELKLMKGYIEQFSELKESIVDLQGNPARLQKMEMYRQDFAIYGIIQALIDDIKANKVYCPQKAQKSLIGSLERLYQMFLSISQMCFAEFDKIKRIGLNDSCPSFQELLDREPEALEYLKGNLNNKQLQYLDENYYRKGGYYTDIMTGIVRKIKDLFPDAKRREIAEFLGVKDSTVRGWLQNHPK